MTSCWVASRWASVSGISTCTVISVAWRWSSGRRRHSKRRSEHVKPIAGTDLCEAPHFQYHIAGTPRIKLADGTEFDATPGQVTTLPSGLVGRQRLRQEVTTSEHLVHGS